MYDVGALRHHAASVLVVASEGRGRPSGQGTSSGQLASNHFTASSRRPTVMSLPTTRRSMTLPSLNTTVLTRERDNLRASP